MANVLIQGSGGGGQKLAPLTTPATADKIKSGKEAYTDAGVKLTGSYVESLPTLNAPTITVSGNVVNIVDGDNGNFSKTWEIRINNLPYRIIAHTGNYTFTELADGTYSVKVKARGDGFNDSEFSNVETMTISTSSPIYGVSGLYDSSTTLTRTDDAVGMSWTMSNNEISSDFDSVFPYNQMVRETINGNVFVKVPAIWWRIGYDSNNYITDIAVSKDEMTPGTGQVVYKSGAFYYGAYKGATENSVLVSKSSKTPDQSVPRAQERTRATSNGTGYQLLDLVHSRILEFLWLIEFADKKSRNIMIGLTNSNYTTGATDNLTAPSGQLGTSDRMRYRYIEDFVGNGFEYVDGIANYYVSDNPANYSEDMSATGTAFSLLGAGTLAAIQIINTNNPLLAPPAYLVANTITAYFCNRVSINTVVIKGTANTNSYVGVFYWSGETANYMNLRTSSRLLYVPTT